MDKDSNVAMLLLLFYGAIAAGIYFLAQRKKHSSQPALKSFLILLLSPLAALVAWFFAIGIVDSALSLPRNGLLSSAIAAAAIGTVIECVRRALKKISLPVEGYVYSPPPPKESLTSGNSISKSVYLEKYRVGEKRLDKAIGLKQIRAEIVDGILYVEDKKI